MTIVRVGTNQKYSTGWEAAFGKGKKKSTATATATGAKAKKPAAKRKPAARKGKKS